MRTVFAGLFVSALLLGSFAYIEHHADGAISSASSTSSFVSVSSLPPTVMLDAPATPSTSTVRVSHFAYRTESSGRVRAVVTFSAEMNQDTLTSDAIMLIPVAGGYPIPVSLVRSSTSVEISSLLPVVSGVSFQIIIRPTVKTKTGISLPDSYASPYFQAVVLANPENAEGGTLQGRVLRADGKPAEGAGVYVVSDDKTLSFNASADVNGAFAIAIPFGAYRAFVFSPSKNGLLPPPPTLFTIRAGGATTLTLSFLEGKKTLTGTVRLVNGDGVDDAEVFIYGKETGVSARAKTDASGHYAFQLSGGDYEVKVYPKDAYGARWASPREASVVSFAKDALDERRTLDIAVPRANGVVKVVVTDARELPVSGVGIVLDSYRAGDKESKGRRAYYTQTTDSAGVASFRVEPGSFFVRVLEKTVTHGASLPEYAVGVGEGGVREVNIVVQPIDPKASQSFSGTTRLDDGRLTDAIVWGWSEKGRFVQSRSNADGVFTLSLAVDDTWHIGATKERVNGFPYRSSELLVKGDSSDRSLDLLMVRTSDVPVAKPAEVSESGSRYIALQTEDGARLTLPPLASGVSGSLTVKIDPTVEAPSGVHARLIGFAYIISLADSSGAFLQYLEGDAELMLPYRDEDLSAQGIDAEDIWLGFFDERLGSWVRLQKNSVDPLRRVVVAPVSRTGRFALLASTDITPPLPPTGIRATALGKGAIRISWTNPSGDFVQTKLYRSQISGSLGVVVAGNIRTSSYEDADGLRDGVRYYYTVRTVDRAGNESSGFVQAGVRALGSSLTQITPDAPVVSRARFTRTLSLGMKGDDVGALQSILIQEGVYPEGIVSGFFGERTRRAVMAFQEKYSSEILSPFGLLRGSGIVGGATRSKLETLSH